MQEMWLFWQIKRGRVMLNDFAKAITAVIVFFAIIAFGLGVLVGWYFL